MKPLPAIDPSKWKSYSVSFTLAWMQGAQCCDGLFSMVLSAPSRDAATATAVDRLRSFAGSVRITDVVSEEVP